MPTIQQIRSLGPSMKGHLFEVEFNNVPFGDSEVLKFRCQSTTIPGLTVEQVKLELHGFSINEPGRAVPDGTWNTTYVDGTDASIITAIDNWMRKASDPETGVIGTDEEIKRNAKIKILNHKKEVTKAFELVGIWPQVRPSASFAGNDSNPVTMDVTWSYDYDRPL